MDTSETYIKMCDCIELESFKKEWTSGDVWYAERPDGTEFPEVHVLGGSPEHGIHICPVCWQQREGTWNQIIWLPRQDQIQEMLTFRYDNYYWLLLRLCNWTSWYMDYIKLFNTIEQLLLAFYMKEKHGKTWDGNKWIEK